MYYQGRWEREFEEQFKPAPPSAPSWLICLALFAGPAIAAAVSVLVAIHVENMDVYLSRLGG
jgi:hypothetical protein